jgi:hypothetical protein
MESLGSIARPVAQRIRSNELTSLLGITAVFAIGAASYNPTFYKSLKFMNKKSPKKFFYPGIKLDTSEVETMTKSWLKSASKKRSSLHPVEEALLYGSVSNPAQCFRVIQKITRKARNERILRNVSVHLLEEVMAYSAQKIKRRIVDEFKTNKGFRIALSNIYLTRKDKGYKTIKRLVKKFHYI